MEGSFKIIILKEALDISDQVLTLIFPNRLHHNGVIVDDFPKQFYP